MRKDFTKEDIIKKHETNVKSAFTAYFLAFVLGLIYVVRYLIKQEFDFYFSLSFTDMMLKLESSGEISKAVCIAAIVVFAVIYIIPMILLLKNPKHLITAAVVYAFDFAVLFFSTFILFPKPQSNDWLIDVIIHLFVMIFLAAGIVSNGKLKKLK